MSLGQEIESDSDELNRQQSTEKKSKSTSRLNRGEREVLSKTAEMDKPSHALVGIYK